MQTTGESPSLQTQRLIESIPQENLLTSSESRKPLYEKLYCVLMIFISTFTMVGLFFLLVMLLPWINGPMLIPFSESSLWTLLSLLIVPIFIGFTVIVIFKIAIALLRDKSPNNRVVFAFTLIYCFCSVIILTVTTFFWVVMWQILLMECDRGN